MPEDPCIVFENGALILGGKYRVERCLGRGGFAEVYLVTHVALNAPRAVKVIHRKAPGVGSTDMRLYWERFTLEARLGARLDHPNIIRVHDFIAEGEEALYLVMEYAPGGSLYDRIEAVRDGKRPPLSVEEVVRMGTDVALGLAALHERQIVHRDLKPSNILFDAEGRAKVADLGLAQVPGGPSRRSQISDDIPHPGTREYMSPEQRETAEYLTPASDVYALGAVLFEALTGQIWAMFPPRGMFPWVREYRKDVPRWLDDVIARMVAESPAHRPRDGSEVAELLEAGWKKEQKPKRLKRRGDRPRRGAPTAERLRWTPWLLAGSVLALILVVGLAVWAFLNRGAAPGAQPPTPTPVPAAVATTRLAPSPTPTPTSIPPTWTPTTTWTPTITPTPLPTATSLPTPTSWPEAVVRTTVLNVRAGPSTLHPIIVQVRQGDKLRLIGKTPDGMWWQVKLSTGQLGWVYGSLVNVVRGANVVPVAKRIPTLPPTLTPTWTPTPTFTPTPPPTPPPPTPTPMLTPTPKSAGTPIAP